MIKVSATNLESYRRYINEKTTLDQLIDSILRRFEPNDKMIKGTKFHEMLQSKDPAPYKEFFSQDCITASRNFMDYRSPLFEIKVRKHYETRHGIVSLTGMADQIIGNKVVEIKTTYSPIQYDTYSDSLQWRVYCDVFQAPEVQYNVFEFKDTLANDFKNCAFFNFFAPANNHETINQWVSDYTDFLYLVGLENALEVQL
jgi:hypothetical protein